MVFRGGKALRCGYTTGACAAGAALAATRMLLTGEVVERVRLDTPKGVALELAILDPAIEANAARCAVQKDSGDDPDITNGIWVYAAAERIAGGIEIAGGEGVGVVTKPGLDQPVGAAAINSGPRRMIEGAVGAACAECGYAGGIKITVSIPGGEVLAKKTFNPRIGVEGGLSVIGTTGIVEPMSSAALLDTIRLELKVRAATGERAVLMCPGNYGETFARKELGLDVRGMVTVSNFLRDAIEAAAACGFSRILLVAHIGKLVKLGIGIANTHSSFGDGRMETLIACALECGAGIELLRAIQGCAVTDAALNCISEAGLLEPTMAALGRRIWGTLGRWAPEGVEIGFIGFTNAEPLKGVLVKSPNADALAAHWRT